MSRFKIFLTIVALIMGILWVSAYKSLDTTGEAVLGDSGGALQRISQWVYSSTYDALVTRIADSDVWMGNGTITVNEVCLSGDSCETSWPVGGVGNDDIVPDFVKSTGQTDEYCLTYELTGDTWEWQTCGSGSGDNVSIDSVAVTDPNFVSTGDIDFIDTTNTITANINAGAIVNADVNASAAIDYSKLSLSGSVVVGDLASANFGDFTCNGSSCTLDASYLQDMVDDATPQFGGDLDVNGYQINVPTDDFDIDTPPIRFLYPDMLDGDDSKGAIIEWAGTMDGSTYDYGQSTWAYHENNSAQFTAPTGEKKWAWITAHYDSPLATGEAVHQHLNFETVQSDWTTAVTRLSISFGEDDALVSFPNSHVKVFNDKFLQIGTDADGLYVEHDTAAGRVDLTTNEPMSINTDIKIGATDDPGANIDVEESTDSVMVKLLNTLGSANGAAQLLIQGSTAGGTAIQTGLSGEGTNRFSMNTSGKMQWGSGSATRDVEMYRSNANELTLDDTFVVGGDFKLGTTQWNSGDDIDGASIADGTLLESAFKAVDTAADEECLTYETTTGDFEWQTCGSGYTNLTSFVDQTAWRLFYSNTDGDVTELALGASGEYLKSNGASAAPTWATPAGSGDVVKVGTPVNNEIGVWTGDGTLEGDTNLQWDGTDFTISGAGTAGSIALEGITILDSVSGTLTLGNVDAIDATTETTLEAALDSLTNLVTVGTIGTGVWQGTAIADAYISDTLTIGASGSIDDGALSANVSLLGSSISTGEITDDTITRADIADSDQVDTKCAIIENLAAADDDFEIFMPSEASTVVSVGAYCDGTCTTAASISLEDRAGNAMTHTAPTPATGTGNATFQSVTAGGALVAGESVRFDVDNAVSPETDKYTICIGVRIDD